MSGPTAPFTRLTTDIYGRTRVVEYGLEWDASLHILDLPCGISEEDALRVKSAIETAFELGARHQRLVAMQPTSERLPDDEEGVPRD